MTAERVTQTEAARRLGLSKQAIGIWCGKPGAPVARIKNVPHPLWPDFPRWRDEQLKAAAAPADFEESRARKEAANAELAELELAERRGLLVTRAGAVKAMTAMCERVRARLIAMPPKVAPLVVGCDTVPQAQRELERAVEEVLAELRGEGAVAKEAAA